MTPTVQEMVDWASASGAVSRAQIEGLLAHHTAGEGYTDPQALADALVEGRHLTPFQATRLLQGETDRLVYGDYVVLEELGRGGMGVVYKARHRHMNTWTIR